MKAYTWNNLAKTKHSETVAHSARTIPVVPKDLLNPLPNPILIQPLLLKTHNAPHFHAPPASLSRP